MNPCSNCFLVLIWGVISLTGCESGGDSLIWTQVLDSIRNEFPDVRQLSTEELAAWLEDKNRPTPAIFDTREKREYQVSHIGNSQHLDAKSNLEIAVRKLKWEAPIVLYCSVGYRSSIVAKKLQKIGYTNVFNLEGSIFKWANEGRALVRNQKPIEEVHPHNENWGQLLDKKFHPNKY